jgi:hypothetical protein
MGASWEGFMLEQVLEACQPSEAFFWATQAGGELDLLFLNRGRTIGVEFKYADAPKMTRSMALAVSDLQLDRLLVVYPGKKRYSLESRIEALPAAEVPKLASILRNISWPKERSQE